MSQREEQMRARMAKQAARRRGSDVDPAEERAHVPPPAPAVRSKPVRITVDLPPILHTTLHRRVGTARVELGLPKLAMADVIRALIEQLDEDEDLAADVLERLRRKHMQ